MRFFDNILVWNEKDLDPDFRLKFKDKLIQGSRGYGYWCWKSQIILQALEAMHDGDILCYADTGCHLNPKGRTRLEYYFQKTEDSPSGILTFQGTWIDAHWTKGDLLKHLDVYSDETVTHTGTLVATTFFIKKSNTTIKLVQNWLGIFESNFSLMDDTPSTTENLSGFKEHRHDQSAFSILCKKINADRLPYSEIQPHYLENDPKANEKLESEFQNPIYAKKDWTPCPAWLRSALKILVLITPIRSWRKKIRIKYNRTGSYTELK